MSDIELLSNRLLLGTHRFFGRAPVFMEHVVMLRTSCSSLTLIFGAGQVVVGWNACAVSHISEDFQYLHTYIIL